MVCANILTSVLIAAAAGLWAATKKRLIRTGISECDGDGEWCGIVLDQGYTARTARSHAKPPRRREFQYPIFSVQYPMSKYGRR